MSYITKFVAGVVVFAVGAMPLLASIPCCQSALSTGCCGPVCPMITKTHVQKGKGTKEIAEAHRCKVCLTFDSPIAIQGKTAPSPKIDARSHDFIDPQPGLVITRAAYAPPRGEQLLHPPRASLCIFLI
jgi:hypothetical protein